MKRPVDFISKLENELPDWVTISGTTQTYKARTMKRYNSPLTASLVFRLKWPGASAASHVKSPPMCWEKKCFFKFERKSML